MCDTLWRKNTVMREIARMLPDEREVRLREFVADWVPCSIQFTGTICAPRYEFLLNACVFRSPSKGASTGSGCTSFATGQNSGYSSVARVATKEVARDRRNIFRTTCVKTKFDAWDRWPTCSEEMCRAFVRQCRLITHASLKSATHFNIDASREIAFFSRSRHVIWFCEKRVIDLNHLLKHNRKCINDSVRRSESPVALYSSIGPIAKFNV